MEPPFDPRKLPRSFYDRKITELTTERNALIDAANELADEIKWWVAGRDQFAPADDANSGQEELDGMSSDRSTHNGIAPENLRAAIRLVMRPGASMRPAEVIDALRQHGWMPTAKSGPQMIRNRLHEMLASDELDRDDDGFYRLSMLYPEDP